MRVAPVSEIALRIPLGKFLWEAASFGPLCLGAVLTGKPLLSKLCLCGVSADRPATALGRVLFGWVLPSIPLARFG